MSSTEVSKEYLETKMALRGLAAPSIEMGKALPSAAHILIQNYELNFDKEIQTNME